MFCKNIFDVLKNISKDYEMLYRAWIGKTRIITPNLEDLDGCESIDIFIDNFWQVFR